MPGHISVMYNLCRAPLLEKDERKIGQNATQVENRQQLAMMEQEIGDSIRLGRLKKRKEKNSLVLMVLLKEDRRIDDPRSSINVMESVSEKRGRWLCSATSSFLSLQMTALRCKMAAPSLVGNFIFVFSLLADRCDQ